MSYLEDVRGWAAGRYWGLLGIEALEAERGTVRKRIGLQEHHLNYNNVAHGGVISSLIDSAGGAAARTLRTPAEIRPRPHATTDLHVSFLAPAGGTELIAEATVVRAGRTAIFTEVNVTDDAGRLVAMGMVTFVIGQPRAEQER